MTIDTNTHWYIIKFLGYKIAFEDYTDKIKSTDSSSDVFGTAIAFL